MKVWRELWFTVLLVVVWASVSWSGIVSAHKLPSPLAVAENFKLHVLDGSFALALGSSLLRLVSGYAISVVLGLTFGIAMSFTKDWAIGIQPVSIALLSMPSVLFVQIAVLWFGPTEQAAIFVILIHATICMALAAIDGAAAIPSRTRHAARILGARGMFYIRSVIVPAALPSILAGAKQAWAYAWRAVLSAELFLSSGFGLGRLVDQAKIAKDLPTMIAVLVVVAIVSQLFDSLVFRRVEQRAIAGAH